MSDDGDDSWDGHQVRSLILVTVGPLSLLGSLFILVTWAAFKALRTPNTLMLACLALSDLLYVSKFVATGALYLAGSDVADENGSALCTFMGVLGQFMGLAAATWNTMIAINLWFMLQYPFKYKPSRWAMAYQAWVWGWSAATSVAILVTGQIGPSGDTTCWVKGSRNLWRLTFFVPLIINWFICLAVLLHLYCSSRLHKTALSTTRLRAAKRIASFVVVFVLMWAPETADRLYEYVAERHTPEWMSVVETTSVALLGVSNASVWVWTLRNLLRKAAAKKEALERRKISSSHSRGDGSRKGARHQRARGRDSGGSSISGTTGGGSFGGWRHGSRGVSLQEYAQPLLEDVAVQSSGPRGGDGDAPGAGGRRGSRASRLQLPSGTKVTADGFVQLNG